MQIHLDALGGVAGDMFAAALLDAFPEHEAGTLASVRAALRPSGQAVGCELLAHNDGILSGRRFAVSAGGAAEGREQGHGGGHAHRHEHHRHHDHGHEHHDHHEHGHHGAGHHGHRPWARIRDDLHRADLAPAVRDHALAIFGHLAQAEARVHGIAVERVAFHEVGAWDSIADIAAAAHLIAAVGASAWSVSALPLGGGRVRTQHGPLPVPAPATTLLLAGFATLDDGVPGERVTPTGAAILRHLCGGAPPARVPRVLVRSGTGFGTRRLPGISNCLRVLAFDEAAPERAAPGGHREIGVIEFEVDDQSGEDLAMGLDALRAHAGVLDAVQMPVFGKKGRMMTHVRVLARAASLEAVLEACFRETTTIGLRHRIVAGVALPRAETVVTTGDRSVRVKTVERPGGRTAKAEADDALAGADHAARARLRREAEALALEGDA